jgi:hypothetical protein
MTMTQTTGKDAVLKAFERLFEKAADRLNIECTSDEKVEAKRYFEERFQDALEIADSVRLPAFPETVIDRLEAKIDELSPAHIAAYLAALPLALQIQDALRALAMQAAERRLIEHLVSQADDRYGGN